MSFSQVKAHFKKDKLHRLAHGKWLYPECMIREAFDKVTRDNVGHYVEHCYKLLEKAA